MQFHEWGGAPFTNLHLSGAPLTNLHLSPLCPTRFVSNSDARPRWIFTGLFRNLSPDWPLIRISTPPLSVLVSSVLISGLFLSFRSDCHPCIAT